MSRQNGQAEVEKDICVHLFTASAGMVGVCITVIGIFQVKSKGASAPPPLPYEPYQICVMPPSTTSSVPVI